MVLILVVVGPNARKEFKETGGTIGRSPSSDLVLSNQFVSNRHATVVYEHGVYYLVDDSINGVFINSVDNRLKRGSRYQLQHGDLVLIEPYELRVELVPDTADVSYLREKRHLPYPSMDDPFGPSMPASSDQDPLRILFGDDYRPPKRPAAAIFGDYHLLGSDDPPWREVFKEGRYVVWFGTNRQPVIRAEAVVEFSSSRDSRTYCGRCEVAIPKSHKIGSTGSPLWKRLLTLTDDRLKVIAVDSMSEDVYWSSVEAALKSVAVDERDAVVFIHGYNVSFEEAALRAAQIGYDLGIAGVMAFYSWPSQGTLQGYAADAASIEASEGFIADFLTRMATQSGAARVHIIAHSMGNRGLLRAIDRIATIAAKDANVPFNQIILAAADVDRDTFARLSVAYKSVAQRTTMYVSARDRAVEASHWLHDYPRAGFTPPVLVVPGIDTINVSNLDLTLLGHGYVAEARDVLQDMHYYLIRQGIPPEQRFGLRRETTPDGETYWMVGA